MDIPKSERLAEIKRHLKNKSKQEDAQIKHINYYVTNE